MILYEVVTIFNGEAYYYHGIKRGSTYFATYSQHLNTWEALTLTIL